MSEKEKTYTIYHALNVLLKQQYWERKFKKYFELISCLLEVEQNNKLLPKIHKFRLTSCTLFPKMNKTSIDNYRRNNGCGHRHGMNN